MVPAYLMRKVVAEKWTLTEIIFLRNNLQKFSVVIHKVVCINLPIFVKFC